VGDSKWEALKALAEAEGIAGVEAGDHDMVARGLLEWRLAVTFARRSLAALDGDRYVELRYEDLVGQPRPTMRTLLAALHLSPAAAVAEFAESHVRHQAPRFGPLVPAHAVIAGDLLGQLGYAD
jgi:hypothetical protein